MQMNEVNKEIKGPFSSIIFLYCYCKTPYNFFSFLPVCFFFCLLKIYIFFNLEIIVDPQEVAKKYTGLCTFPSSSSINVLHDCRAGPRAGDECWNKPGACVDSSRYAGTPVGDVSGVQKV